VRPRNLAEEGLLDCRSVAPQSFYLFEHPGAGRRLRYLAAPEIINSVIFGPMSVRSDRAASAVFCKVRQFDKIVMRQSGRPIARPLRPPVGNSGLRIVTVPS
jgi:hypothetical protein